MKTVSRLIAGVAMAVGLATSAQATTIIYSSGHAIDTTAAALGGVTMAAGNPLSGFSTGIATVSAAIGDGSTGAYGAYDAFVTGENLSWSAASKAAFRSYVIGGGHGVVLGAHGSEVAFLNSTFAADGFAVGAGPATSSFDDGPISRLAGSGPATLLGLNGSWYLDAATLPAGATQLYERDDNSAAAAFVMNLGAGTLSWLAWDFCECGNADSLQADWFSVLGEGAIGIGVVPEPATIALLGLGLVGMGGFGARRRAA